MPADPPILDYQQPADRAHATVASPALPTVLFVLTGVGFVPLHVFLGPNVIIGLGSVLAFAAGGMVAARCLHRRFSRDMAMSLAINVLGLAGVVVYLIYFWPILETFGRLGK